MCYKSWAYLEIANFEKNFQKWYILLSPDLKIGRLWTYDIVFVINYGRLL